MADAFGDLATAATRRNGLEGFFDRERRRAARRIALPVALLSSGAHRYLLRRSGVLFARLPVRTLFHVAEMIVFADFLELGLLGPLLFVRGVTTAFGAFHWGALEPLRRAVRAAVARGNPAAAEAEIARYLRLAVDLCIFQLFVLVAWMELGPRPFASFSIFDAYAIGCGIRAMAETVTRTLHAGAFALRRIRRPTWSLFALDAADAGTALLLWPWLGPWGFAVAQLVGAAVEAAFTLRYVRRTYRALPIAAPTLRRAWSGSARAPWRLLPGMIGPGFGNLAAQVDALIVTALALGASEQGLALAVALHVLRPVLSLGSAFPRLFYFDLARLESPLRRLFQLRFERLLAFAAPVFALVSAGVAALLGVTLMPVFATLSLAVLLPFLLVRALYGAAQVQAFARGAYLSLVAGAGVVSALSLALPRFGADERILLGAATAGLGVGALLFALRLGARKPPEAAVSAGASGELLRPLPFLAALARHAGPVQVHLVGVNPQAGANALRLAQRLSALPDVRQAARLDRRTLALAGPPVEAPLPAVVAASGGAIDAFRSLPAAPDGKTALASLLDTGSFEAPHVSREPMSSEPIPDEAELRRAFARDFPAGITLDRASGAVPDRTATPRELANTLHELGELASGVRPARRRGLRAAVFAPGGEARVVFVAGRDADPERFGAFERSALRASVYGTLGGDSGGASQ